MADAAASLLRPPDNATLTFAPIGDLVNKVANDGPEIQTPVGPPLGGIVSLDLAPDDQGPAQQSLF